jgi:hypothetical protein
MFFERPDVRYVDMCIYIDEHIYTDDYDVSRVYQYLYHIIRMIALKRAYFPKKVDLDDFSLYAASSYYMRLTDERQFSSDSPIEPVRSILNYIRKTLFSVRREYCRKHFNDNEVCESDIVSIDTDSFSNYVSRKIDYIGKIDFGSCLETTQVLVKKYLMDIPYKYGTSTWNNIYISCMMSFLNSITLKNRDIKRINNFKRPNSLTDEMLNKLYLEERYAPTILFHLDSSMYNYITILTNKIRHKIAADLSQSLHTFTPSHINMKNLMVSSVSEDKDY